ncbi:MAG: hypothetical protein ACOX8B_02705 [Lachnospiraceae bacterium]
MSDITKEKNEAITAGQAALESLHNVERYLNNARGWGAVDLLGGGLISGIMKHSSLNSASQALSQAKHDLAVFERELKDLENIPDLKIHVGDFLTFIDLFADNFFADALVQSKINESRRQVEEMINRIENILDQLQAI